MSDKNKYVAGRGASCGVYGLGLIGALVYYLPHVTTWQQGLLGFLKALVWPALLVYKMMAFLNM